MPEVANFVPFIPRAVLDAKSNRDDFVHFCRTKLAIFGADLDFDSPSWEVSSTFKQRGGSSQRRHLNFTAFASQGKSEIHRRVGMPLPEPLGAFAKAYILYFVARRQSARMPEKSLAAFRVLHVALAGKGLPADIGLVDGHVLDHAVEICRRTFTQATAGDVASRLSEIASFLNGKSLSDRIPMDWKHGVTRPKRMNDRLGQDAALRREERLPSRDALDAIPVAFGLATEARDVILTSVMALLCCAPDRINEVFALQVDCEVEEVVDGKAMYGLRWAGSKGHHDFLKPIVHVMSDTARSALERLRRHTANARLVATWYETNPGKLYLSPDCERLRGLDLTASDIAEVTGMVNSDSVKAWTRNNRILKTGTKLGLRGKIANTYSFADVERAIVGLLPPGFPVLDDRTGLRYSRALLIVRRYEFGEPKYRPWRCMVEPLSYDTVKNGFGGAATASVFDRLGLSTEEKPLRVNSHQLRHYLNTLAMKADVSQVDVAAWSGRLNASQNSAYDHETAEEIFERQRWVAAEVRRLEAGQEGMAARTVAVGNLPVSRSDILAGGGHGHVTELGFCRHDFASAPCAMFMECLHCTKHVCIKGHDPRHLEKVRGALELARSSLDKALSGVAEGYEGAEEWAQAHAESVQRLEQLLALLTDPEIPDGSTIALARSGRYTLVEQAMRDRGEDDGRLSAAAIVQFALPGRHAT